MNTKKILLMAALLLPLAVSSQTVLKSGLVISKSTDVKSRVYLLPNDSGLITGTIVIEGDNIVVDFANAELIGNAEMSNPEKFSGLGVLIKNSNGVTIKNLKIHGYKIALMAVKCTKVTIQDCDFSYNYRPRLFSIREREVVSDWLSYHNNEKDEWTKYGCGIYLKSCTNSFIKDVVITQSFNGIMLNRSNSNEILNCIINFNSGVGIALYRSSGNKIMHNLVDYNVRGFSNNFYRRGQDSAGLLVYEQSNNNVFAYNSVTHCGDGLFLWAGNYTMESGQGGCNDNTIFGNDFSYAPTNGVEATFSRNRIINNTIRGCQYGVWAGYSYNTVIDLNHFGGSKEGIAIENGQDNTISSNLFQGDTLCIHVWARDKQPANWEYPKKRDVSSTKYTMEKNSFFNSSYPFKVTKTSNVTITGNYVAECKMLFASTEGTTPLSFKNNQVYSSSEQLEKATVYPGNKFYTEDEFQGFDITVDEAEPTFDDDCENCFMPSMAEDNVSSILMNEWGPYNNAYPFINLTEASGTNMNFQIKGKLNGIWTVVESKGLKNLSATTGSMNGVLTAERDSSAIVSLKLKYDGDAFKDQFGTQHDKNTAYEFSFQRVLKPLIWKVNFYNYDSLTLNPAKNYAGFKLLKAKKPVASKAVDELAFNWYGAPADSVREDAFATFASTDIDITPGEYQVNLTSDDGVKLFLDGVEIFSRWNKHESATDVVNVKLTGHNKLEVEHFDADGFAGLDFYLSKK